MFTINTADHFHTTTEAYQFQLFNYILKTKNFKGLLNIQKYVYLTQKLPSNANKQLEQSTTTTTSQDFLVVN